jgi:hypothetical protein
LTFGVGKLAVWDPRMHTKPPKPFEIYRDTSLIRDRPPQDPTVGLCLGS